MNRKAYLKDPYVDTPPTPFTGFDYLLSAAAFVLLAIASIPRLAAMILPGK
jgi:hypothetical protein